MGRRDSGHGAPRGRLPEPADREVPRRHARPRLPRGAPRQGPDRYPRSRRDHQQPAGVRRRGRLADRARPPVHGRLTRAAPCDLIKGVQTCVPIRSPASMKTRATLLPALFALLWLPGVPVPAERPATAPDGWQVASPRDEIRPHFTFDPMGGRSGKGALVIEADGREGLDGYWVKDFPVVGGRHYRFQAFRKATNVAVPRRSVFVRLSWLDAKGNKVEEDRPVVTAFLKTPHGPAVIEHPTDHDTDANGWTEVADVYRAPAGAALARVELRLQWA